ncbi:MAG: Txe/YoeB family addiction module toxin [Oscillospiraceae bacterium]|nr:Txe/YoeB family addiction module toxin [Oscillospiraceae bacterium]
MKDNVTFSPDGWADYLYWQTEDRKTLKRINQLIADIIRSGLTVGVGKPERLRHIDGWSRRIDDANRLAYTEENGTLVILSCRGHYDD